MYDVRCEDGVNVVEYSQSMTLPSLTLMASIDLAYNAAILSLCGNGTIDILHTHDEILSSICMLVEGSNI